MQNHKFNALFLSLLAKANCVVRVPVLFGYTEPNRYDESAINCLIDKVKKGETFQVDNFQVRYPTHCLDVARFLNRLMIRYFQVRRHFYFSFIYFSILVISIYLYFRKQQRLARIRSQAFFIVLPWTCIRNMKCRV
jgi:hypothetical protein